MLHSDLLAQLTLPHLWGEKESYFKHRNLYWHKLPKTYLKFNSKYLDSLNTMFRSEPDNNSFLWIVSRDLQAQVISPISSSKPLKERLSKAAGYDQEGNSPKPATNSEWTMLRLHNASPTTREILPSLCSIPHSQGQAGTVFQMAQKSVIGRRGGAILHKLIYICGYTDPILGFQDTVKIDDHTELTTARAESFS